MHRTDLPLYLLLLFVPGLTFVLLKLKLYELFELFAEEDQ